MRNIGNLLKLMLVIVLCFLMSIFSYASPSKEKDDDINSFLDRFKLSSSILTEEASTDSDDINNFGAFELSQGFSRFAYSTFAEQKVISGAGRQGIEIGVLVYSIDKEQVVLTIRPSVVTIGASGLYSFTIPYDVIGENHVIISVKNKNDVIYKKFVINRKDPKSRAIIEKLNINLFAESNQISVETSDAKADNTKFSLIINK